VPPVGGRRTTSARQDAEEAGREWLQASGAPGLRHAAAVSGEPWMLDVDTTVTPLYCHQEAAVVGCNPKKPGRPLHTYHSYILANLQFLLEVEVQAGNQRAAKHSAPGPRRTARPRPIQWRPQPDIMGWFCATRRHLKKTAHKACYGKSAALGEQRRCDTIKRTVGLAEGKAAIVAVAAGDVLCEVERAPDIGHVLCRHFPGAGFQCFWHGNGSASGRGGCQNQGSFLRCAARSMMLAARF
jgi:hypothetical protein